MGRRALQLAGQRVKVSREIAVGDILHIRQGWHGRVVAVKGLSDQRRGAAEAQLLYEETAASLAKREEDCATRKAAGGMIDRPAQRPDKRQRRQIHRFKDSSY